MKDLDAVKHLIDVLEEKTMEDTAFALVYEHQLDDPRFHAFVCENGGRIVAFVNIRIEYQLHHAGKVAQIMELVTEEDCRGSGIGRELFRHVCEYANKKAVFRSNSTAVCGGPTPITSTRQTACGKITSTLRCRCRPYLN